LFFFSVALYSYLIPNDRVEGGEVKGQGVQDRAHNRQDNKTTTASGRRILMRWKTTLPCCHPSRRQMGSSDLDPI